MPATRFATIAPGFGLQDEFDVLLLDAALLIADGNTEAARDPLDRANASARSPAGRRAVTAVRAGVPAPR